jgi:hypothetical protein
MAVIAKRKAKKLNIFEKLAIELLDATGDYEKDCIVGGALAWRFIEDRRKDGIPGGLNSIILELMKKGKGEPKHKGRIIGFVATYDDCAMVPWIGPSPKMRSYLGLEI